MAPRADEVAWALAGNLVVGIGAGTATYAAFQSELPLVGHQPFAVRVVLVAVGFGLFFAGYRVSQAGTYRDGDESIVESFRPEVEGHPESGSVDAFLLLRGGFVLLGVVGLAVGMILFALTIRTWDPYNGLLAGLVCIGGYISGHVGMNSSLL